MSFLQPQIKGSIAVGATVGATAQVAMLPVGADGTVLVAKSAQPSGVAYGTPAFSSSGELFGLFGSGADGDLSLGGDTTITLQDNIVIKHYNNLSINGFVFGTAEGQGAAIIYVNGTLNLGAGGIVQSAGNPHQFGDKSSTALKALNIGGTIPGGNGAAPGGSLWVFARTITGSGTIRANGVTGANGANNTTPVGSTAGGNYAASASGFILGFDWTYSARGAVAAVGGGGAGGAGGAIDTRTDQNLVSFYKNPMSYFSGVPPKYRDQTSAPLISSNEKSANTTNPYLHQMLSGQAGASGTECYSDGSPFKAAGSGGGSGGSAFVGVDGGAGGAGGSVASSSASYDIAGFKLSNGGGGGGGGGGGICVVRCASNLTSTLAVEAKGGAGGNAGATQASADTGTTGQISCGGSGGGGGGAGGIVIFSGPYNAGLTVSAAGGAGGAGGAGTSKGIPSGRIDGDPGATGATGGAGYAFNSSYVSNVLVS